MEPNPLRRNVRLAFTLAALTAAVQVILLFSLALLSVGLPAGLLPKYFTDFLLPQILYPVMTGGLALIFLICADAPLKEMIPLRKVRANEFLPWFGVFLLVSVVANDLTDRISYLLEDSGVPVEDVFAEAEPTTALQAAGYFFVIAVLPPLSEELLFRAGVAGLIRQSHPTAAVLLSAFAFGLMHATLQQIPFAFGVGLVLGLVYVRTGNFIYPVLFHFFNNAWACVLTFLSAWGHEAAAMALGAAADAVFVVAGVFGLVYLIRRGRLLPYVSPEQKALRPVHSTVSAPSFWIFTGIYLTLTVIGVWVG